jgi:hypothetical protein
VLFTKSGLLDTYNGYVHEVQAAGEDQVNAQRKIINLHN